MKKGLGISQKSGTSRTSFDIFLEKNMSAISSTRNTVLQGQGSIPCAKVEQSATLCFVVPFEGMTKQILRDSILSDKRIHFSIFFEKK